MSAWQHWCLTRHIISMHGMQVQPALLNPDQLADHHAEDTPRNAGMHSVVTSEVTQQRLPTPRGFYALVRVLIPTCISCNFGSSAMM
jgi:hypothetical protein